MRKILEIVALVWLLGAWVITGYAILGPGDRLPARIPTHFNAAGQPNGWGTPAMLWMMPVVATVIYGLMTLVARFPGAFNFPMRIRPAARRQLEEIALNLIAWLKAEVLCLFTWIQYETIRFAMRGEGRLPALFLPAVLAAVFGTIAWHIVVMRRVARGF